MLELSMGAILGWDAYLNKNAEYDDDGSQRASWNNVNDIMHSLSLTHSIARKSIECRSVWIIAFYMSHMHIASYIELRMHLVSAVGGN